MELIVLLKQVPDLAEELEIDASGTELARDWLSYVTSEWDEYALEEALQLRDLAGGTLTCLALDTGSVDELLATCLARGADQVVKVGGVTIIGYLNMAGRIAASASALLARNIYAFVEPMIDKTTKQLSIKRDDEIVAATLLTADGRIVHPSFATNPGGGGQP